MMSSQTPTPIETRYKGYRFRSRLEARWAVFFDEIGLKYEYEPQGYKLDRILYLPDFWMPSIKSFIEIKPTRPSGEEMGKAELLATKTGFNTFIFFDGIPFPFPDSDCESAMLFSSTGFDSAHFWCECSKCGSLEIQFNGRSERNSCGCSDPYGAETQTADSSRLKCGYVAARSARFEGGLL